jgi:glycosyltransferase involved in cell wall biosynthesis
MAMGKAIICSDMAQMAEILIHNKTAYMVKPADIDELMNAMKILIDDEKIREVLSKNAREEAVAKYTWDKHVENILEKINE